MFATAIGATTGVVITYYLIKHQRKQDELKVLTQVSKAYLTLESELYHPEIQKKDEDRLLTDLEYLKNSLSKDMKLLLSIDERSSIQEATMDRIGVLLTILDNIGYYSLNSQELKRSIRFSSIQEMNEV